MDINPGLSFFTWVTFGLLFFFLYKFGWGSIVTALTEREEKIQNDVTTAEEEREKAEQLRKERENELNEARTEASEIVENSREKGEKVHDEIVEDAEERAESMISDAEQQIEQEREEAFQAVESEVGELALKLSEKFLDENVDEDDHQRLVDQFLQEIDSEEEIALQ